MPGWLWAVPPRNYPVYVKTRTFAVRRVGRGALERVRPGDVIFAYLSGSKVIAGMFEAVGTAFQDSTPLVPGAHFPHRLRVRPVAVLSEEAYVPYDAFADKLDVTTESGSFRSVVQGVLHPLPRVDEKVLEFLVRARQPGDLEDVLAAYDAYLRARTDADARAIAAAYPQAAASAGDASTEEGDAPTVAEAPVFYAAGPFDRAAALETLLAYVAGRGFVYEPWQVAAYVTALRTKPFVILAGVTGTGKSKLPALVAAGTGGTVRVVPVRPDWTDSAEVLGYVDLRGAFRPGAALRAAREAGEAPDRHHTLVLDEMNLARVEHYFAEVLSRIEERPGTGGTPAPLVGLGLGAADAEWGAVTLPPNLALVGTVNVDESAHTFSRKVLDRAFTLELATVDLGAWAAPPGAEAPAVRWPVTAWQPRAVRLPGLDGLGSAERERVEAAVAALEAANRHLAGAGLHAAYRTRDEVALFVLHAEAVRDAFRTRGGAPVDPLDLALHMKLLPRLAGGSRPVARAVRGLLGWAAEGAAATDEAAADRIVEAWEAAARPSALPDARYPRTAARLCLMHERLRLDGFTSFWL